MTEFARLDRYLVPGLQRGLQLLAQFTRATPQLTGAELSRRLKLPRASVFRILQTLEYMGFVERQSDNAHYKLSIGVLRLGFEYLASMELTEHGRPVLESLSSATGLSSHLVVRDGTEVVFIAKALGRASLFNSVQVGARLPAHATVLGRILLADLSLPELKNLYAGQQFAAFTPQTPTTLDQLWQRMEQDRARGYGISQSGFESGISSIAAPVFDGCNKLVAAVSVTIPASQIEAQQRDELTAQVMAAAARLSQGSSPTASVKSKVASQLNKAFA
ncbi:MAG: IclR family transcriptional regulator [Burkholderiaceae bacterium]